jgi:hypothetical protein
MGDYMRTMCLVFMAIVVIAGNSFAKLQHGWKGTVHLIAVPLIAGSGIYTDVRVLQTADEAGTKAGAITNLALLGAQAALGATIYLGNDNQPPAIRLIHRIVGASVLVSSIWLNVAGTMDKGVATPAKYTSYAHSVLVAAPLILFTF